MPEQENGGDGVVTVRENIRFYAHKITNRPFRGEAAAIYFGVNAFNDDPFTAILFRRFKGSSLNIFFENGTLLHSHPPWDKAQAQDVTSELYTVCFLAIRL